MQGGGVWQDGPPAGWVSGGMASGRMSLRQDGPPKVRFPRDTWPASRDFRRKVPEEETALQVSGRTRTKPRLRLQELVKEVMERSNNTDKIKAIMKRWLQGSGLGGPNSRSRDRCSNEPNLKELQLAEKLILMTAITEVDALVKGSKTLGRLAPRWSRGPGSPEVFNFTTPSSGTLSKLPYSLILWTHKLLG